MEHARYLFRAIFEDLSHAGSRLLDDSQKGIIAIDREGTIILYHRAARRIFGEQNESFAELNFADLRPEARPGLREILKSDKQQSTEDDPYRRRGHLPLCTVSLTRTKGDSYAWVLQYGDSHRCHPAILPIGSN